MTLKQNCILSIVLFLLCSIHVQAQYSIDLPYLEINNPILEEPLSSVNSHLGESVHGKSFPICKIVFVTNTTDSIDFDFFVEAVDNSWTNLFRPDQIRYGYTIVNNRLFVVSSDKNDIVNLENMFYSLDDYRKFNLTQKPPSWDNSIPVWYYKFNLLKNQFDLVRTENLDILK